MNTFTRRRLLATAGTALLTGAAGAMLGLRISHKRPKHVILVVIDALRADHLGCYGGRYQTALGPISLTPKLDRIASRGTVFERCVAPSSWTMMSVPSILASRFPFVEGDVFNLSFLPPRALTLAQVLRSAGYSTHAILANPSLQIETSGKDTICRGFDTYEVQPADMVPNPFLAKGLGPKKVYEHLPRAKPILTSGLERLRRAHAAGKPAFIYVHLMETHEPYTAAPQFTRRLGPPPAGIPDFMTYHVIRYWANCNKRTVIGKGDRPLVERAHEVYRAATRTVDDDLDLLIDYLDGSDEGAETLLVVTSDHGEEFADHNWIGHAETLYDECLHVPFIMWGAGIPRGLRRSNAVSSIDIAPTILRTLGLGAPRSMAGEALDLTDASTARIRPMISSVAKPPTGGLMTERVYSLMDPSGMKLIRHEFGGPNAGKPATTELYDRANDPQEKANLLSAQPQVAARLDQHLQVIRVRNRSGEAARTNIDEKSMEQLKALGYIGG